MVNHKSSNILLGKDISRLSPTSQFLGCSSGVLILYLLYGFVQEKLFRIDGFRSHGWYLSFMQFIFVTILAYIDSKFVSRSINLKESMPYIELMALSWMTVGTMGLSTVSLGYLNFPTQVIFKSCKLIPVMIGGILILGKRYKLIDYVSVGLMSFGLTWFSLADQTVSPEFHIAGIILICLALAVDGCYGNYQEKLMRKYPHITNSDIAFYSYSFGSMLILTWLVSTGTFLRSLRFVAKHNEIYGLAFVYSLIGYVGQQFVLALMKSSGALVSSIVTTTRKVLTIVLSFLFFTKPFTVQYVWSGGLVFLGILLNIYTRNKNAIDVGADDLLRSIRNFIKSHKPPLYSKVKLVQQV